MKKIFLLLLIVAMILSFSVTAFAEETVEETVTEETVEETVTETEQPFSEVIYAYCKDNASNIFSLLSFLGAVILAVFYKKGLLPAVSNSINKLGKHLSDGIDAAKKMAEDTDGNLTKFMDGVKPVIEKLEGIPDVAKKMYEENVKLEAELTKATTEREILTKALKSQSNMFYELFMASNLPQYQKDKVSKGKAEIDHIIEVLENADEVRDS